MVQKQHTRISKYGKPYVAGKRKKRIVIGGDPHSGKSTFMALLHDELKSKKLDVELFELDAAAGDVQRFKTGKRIEKRPWTPELAKQTHESFIRQARNNDLTLGDTPGKVSSVTRTVTQGAHGAIVLYRDDTSRRRWLSFFGHKRIPVIAQVDSKLIGRGYFNARTNKGRVVGLHRRRYQRGEIDKEMAAIEGVAFEIAQFFNFSYYDERRF